MYPQCYVQWTRQNNAKWGRVIPVWEKPGSLEQGRAALSKEIKVFKRNIKTIFKTQNSLLPITTFPSFSFVHPMTVTNLHPDRSNTHTTQSRELLPEITSTGEGAGFVRGIHYAPKHMWHVGLMSASQDSSSSSSSICTDFLFLIVCR